MVASRFHDHFSDRCAADSQIIEDVSKEAGKLLLLAEEANTWFAYDVLPTMDFIEKARSARDFSRNLKDVDAFQSVLARCSDPEFFRGSAANFQALEVAQQFQIRFGLYGASHRLGCGA